MTEISLTHSPELDGFRGVLHFAKDPLGALEEARRLHGSFVGYTQQNSVKVHLLMEPALVDELLVKHADSLEKDEFTKALGPILGKGLLTNDGPHWKEQRKLLAPSFQPKHIGKYASVMVEATEELVAGFSPQDVRDVHTDMMGVTLDIVLRTLFGTSAVRTSEVGELLDMIMDDYRRLTMSFRVAFPQWFPFYSRIRFKRMRKKLRRVVDEVIQARRQAPLTDDMLSRLLEAKDDAGRGMSDEQLLDECLTVMLAGHETTALALMFALDQLTRHPALMAELEEELERELQGRSATLDDVPKLRLTRAIVKETLRLFPPAWAAGRVAIADFELGGLPVTRGTQLIVVPWVVQRDERFYKEPLAYRPERFLNGETEGLPKGAYFPFGAGPRFCIGYHFAELEAALVLATLVQRCHWTSQSAAPLALSPSVTLRPAGPVRLGVVVRSKDASDQAA
jgi:cytochrome P450